MRKRRIRSPWECESDVDYYEQFEEQVTNEDDFIEPDDDFEPFDNDCEYWKSNCYGRG